MTQFETIEDSQLDQVAGGLSFNLTLDSNGISASGPLGEISVPNPLTVATDLVGGLTGRLGDFLTKFGTKLSELGQIFKFS